MYHITISATIKISSTNPPTVVPTIMATDERNMQLDEICNINLQYSNTYENLIVVPEQFN